MRASKVGAVDEGVGVVGLAGTLGRVVQLGDSQSRGSSATSRATTVPLPTPPGPETTMITAVQR